MVGGQSSGHGRVRLLVLVMSVSVLGTFASAGPAMASYSYTCDAAGSNYHKGVTANWQQDVTSQSYWVEEVVSYVWIRHQYPCAGTTPEPGHTGLYGLNYDDPAILGANLQQWDNNGTNIVQIGAQTCSAGYCPSGWTPGKEMLVYTPNDAKGGVVYDYTGFSGAPGGVLTDGDEYEFALVAISVSGDYYWEFGVRGISPSSGWKYWTIPDDWTNGAPFPEPYGNFAWWGDEVNNYASAMGHAQADASNDMNTMEFEDTTNSWHPQTPTICDWNYPGAPWYNCSTDPIKFGPMDTYTKDH